MYPFTNKYRIPAFQIFPEQTVDKLISLRLEQIQMIHAIFLTTDFRAIMCQCQRMSGDIYFRNDFYAQTIGHQLEINKFFLCIIAVT